MNGDEANKRLNAIEEEAKKLREIINAPDASGNPIFYPKAPDIAHYLTSSRIEEKSPFSVQRIEAGRSGWAQPAFRTKEVADAWADAITVILELRTCEGYDPIGKYAMNIRLSSKSIDAQDMSYWRDSSKIFGTFATQIDVLRAIEKVGKERILKATATICGVYA